MQNGEKYVTTSAISDGHLYSNGGLSGSLPYHRIKYTSEENERREKRHTLWMVIVVAVIVLILVCAIIAAIVVAVVMDKDESSATVYIDDPLCRSRKCRTHEETSRPSDGAQSPKYPLSYADFRRYVAPNKMREFFYFSRPVAYKHLRRLVVTWVDMGDGTFQNSFVAREPTYDVCINEAATPLGGPITLTPVGDGTASFRFMNFDGSPDIYMGHIFSACPDKYFFNWYCPEVDIDSSGYCTQNALMDLVFTDLVPDHLPWQTIVTDLHNNTGLYMDDQRWTLTFRGDNCENTV